MKNIWIVDWEDISVACLTPEAAKAYVEREARKIRATIRWVEEKDNYIYFYCKYWPGHFEQYYYILKLDVIEG